MKLINRVLGALLAVVVGLACAPMAYAASASTPGASLTEEALPDRTFQIRYTNIINNYLAKTSPGGADSSVAYQIGGATDLNLVLYYIVSQDNDSTIVDYQDVMLEVRWGWGATTDTTGHFPIASVKRATVAGAADTIPLPELWRANNADKSSVHRAAGVGTTVVQCAPYTLPGRHYEIVRLGTPPLGATFVSVKLIVGTIRSSITGFDRVPAASWGATAAAKFAVAYRLDLFGGR